MKTRSSWNTVHRNGCRTVAVALGCLSGAAHAATVVWQEPVSGSFNNPQRWLVANSFPEERRLPNAGDDIQIIAGPAITVDLAGGATVANADIGETVTLNLSGTLAVTGTLDGAPIISGQGKVTAAQWRVGSPTPAISGATAEVGSLGLTGNGYGIMVLGGGTLKAGAYSAPNARGHAPLLVDGANATFTLTGPLDELAAPALEITVRNGATATMGAVNRAGTFVLENGGHATTGFFQPLHVAVRSGSTLTTGEAKPLGFGPASGLGVAEVSGGTWNIGGKLTLSGSTSTLRVSGGGHMQAQSVDLTDFARLQVGNVPFQQGGPVVLDDGVLTVSGAVQKNAGTLSVLGGEFTCDSLNLLGEGALQGESGLTASNGSITVAGSAVFDTIGTLKTTRMEARTAVIGSSEGRRGQLTMETCEFRLKESLIIGQAGTGSLLAITPFPGPASAPDIVLGAAAKGSGSLEISSAGAPSFGWSFKDKFVVGDAGEGTFTIRHAEVAFASAENITIAKQPGSRGTVRVIGDTAYWSVMPIDATGAVPVVVGEGGRGTLSIDGAEVRLLSCTIGRSGDDNICQVSGPHPGDASTRNLDVPATFIVGDGGHGTLSLDAKATVHAGTLVVGKQSTADNRVTVGSGCHLSGGFKTVIGDSGTGRLDVSGSADCGRLIIARGDGSRGTVNFSGDGATFNIQTIEMGGKPQARATLSLLAGIKGEARELLVPVPPAGQADITINGTQTELTITNRLHLGRIGQASGPVTCNISGGAKMLTGQEVLVRKNARLAATGSTVLVGPGALPPAGTLLLRSGGRLTGDGTVASRVEVATGGILAPGAALGTLTIEGDVVARADSTLEFEISGLTAPAGHDSLHTTGAVNVQGIVNLRFINGYAPKAGDRYCFITADGGLTFAPTGINVSGLAPGFSWTLSGDANNFCITASNAGQPDTKPELTIAPNTDDGLSLNWSAENWQLESAEDLNGNWQPVPSPPTGEGSFTQEVTPGGGASFWRLRK